MPAYDGVHFDPPAPVARVILRCPQTASQVADVQVLLDSGADVTLLPRAAAIQLGTAATLEQRCELMGFDGSRSFAEVVFLDVILLGKAFRGRYLLTDDPCGILGRDVLNHLSIRLDGPGLIWSASNR
jgi:hypothetical protein